MSDTLVTIEASERASIGKGYARKLRKSGKIPAVLLDSGKATSLELDPKLLGRAYKECDRKFNMSLNGETKVVSIKEVQIDKVKRTALHVDLMYVK